MRYLVKDDSSSSQTTTSKSGTTSDNGFAARKSGKTSVSTTPLAAHKRTTRSKVRECDFYMNPTILSRLILHQKYESAMRRLKTAPLEACTWVSARRQNDEDDHHSPSNKNAHNNNKRSSGTSSSISSASLHDMRQLSISELTEGSLTCAPEYHPYNPDAVTPSEIQIEEKKEAATTTTMVKESSAQEEYSYRQLPIHMACSDLSRVVDPVLRQHVEQLIGQLIVVYADACQERDHQHRLPLHEALWNNARTETLVLLMIAYPQAAHERDVYGRTALELNQHRKCDDENQKAEVSRLLQRDESFWALAKQEASLRLKHNNLRTHRSSSDDGDDVASIDSTSVLMDSMADDYTLVTRDSIRQGRASPGYNRSSRPSSSSPRNGNNNNNNNNNNKRSPTAWSQLEKRALHLEQLLAQRYQENYQMGQEISRLTKIANEYEQMSSSKYMAQQVLKLQAENDNLQRQVHRRDVLLQRNGILVPTAKDDNDSGNNNNKNNNSRDSNSYPDETASTASTAPLEVTVQHTTTTTATVGANTSSSTLERLQHEEKKNQLLQSQVQQLTAQMSEYQVLLSHYENLHHYELQSVTSGGPPKPGEETTTGSPTTKTQPTMTDPMMDTDGAASTSSSASTTPNANNNTSGETTSLMSTEGQLLQNNLDGLLDVAEQLYGITFSAEMVQAWRSTAVPDWNDWVLDDDDDDVDNVMEKTVENDNDKGAIAGVGGTAMPGGGSAVLDDILEGDDEEESEDS